MEAQQDAQATGSTTARPRQPTDAPGATLPTETLAQILDASLDGLEGWQLHQAKMAFACVCEAWYGIVGVGTEIAVKDTKMAERLAKTLKGRQGAEQRSRIRSLSVGIEADGAGRSQRIASLLLACRGIDTLELVAEDGVNLGSRYCQLGKPLTQALQKLSLRTFRMISTTKISRGPFLGTAGFFELCSGWPQLQMLTLDNFCTSSLMNPHLPPSFSLPLTRLHLPVPEGLEREELAPLLAAASDTLRHLHFSKPTSSTLSLSRSPAPFTPVVAVAPQLLSLTAISEGCYATGVVLDEHWWPTLSALRDIQDLRIGCFGYKLDEILPLLQRLEHLRILSITNLRVRTARFPNTLDFSQLAPTAVLDFIAEAPALRSLTLPTEVHPIWTAEELKEVEVAAEKKDVRFELE